MTGDGTMYGRDWAGRPRQYPRCEFREIEYHDPALDFSDLLHLPKTFSAVEFFSRAIASSVHFCRKEGT